ncbi:hypothetical protein T03_2395 [Trichinella britovi]|uniref:Uncharacterized protein n=1 Tax=Trichinella britovi TaxID=45882 RepID=A0A0V1CR76_TRIBR|nr:hypothetical protein T03_2395 [Trichinella britovi]
MLTVPHFTCIYGRRDILGNWQVNFEYGINQRLDYQLLKQAVGIKLQMIEMVSRKKLTSGKARTSHRDASRQKKLKGRKSRSPRSRSQLNSRHRSRSRSPSRSNSATRRL